MKLLLSYLKRHTTLIAALALAIAVFACVFKLYDLPAEAVWYASALTVAVYAVLGVVRFISYKKRHRALMALASRMDVELAGMPVPSDMIEADYQRLLSTLYENRRALEDKLSARAAETDEYYTLWAHQIKTPIAAMRLMLGASDRDALLAAELFKTEQYVSMALNFVRAGSDATDYVIKKYDVDETVRTCIRKYARMFVMSRTKLAFAPTGITALTDEKWLGFCIEQILSNALKYASGKSVSVYGEGDTLVIEDTGMGIAAEDVPRVFDRGYTGYNGRADRKSTGIGLYLVKTVLTRLGHAISIESEPARGTRVYIDLSAHDAVYE